MLVKVLTAIACAVVLHCLSRWISFRFLHRRGQAGSGMPDALGAVPFRVALMPLPPAVK